MAAALALAATWRPRGILLLACSCSAGGSDLAHVPVSRRDLWGYLMASQLLHSKRSPSSTSSRDATTGAPGAALPGREMAASDTADAGAGLRSEFLDVLLSRRRDLQGQSSLPLTRVRVSAARRFRNGFTNLVRILLAVSIGLISGLIF